MREGVFLVENYLLIPKIRTWWSVDSYCPSDKLLQKQEGYFKWFRYNHKTLMPNKEAPNCSAGELLLQCSLPPNSWRSIQ